MFDVSSVTGQSVVLYYLISSDFCFLSFYSHIFFNSCFDVFCLYFDEMVPELHELQLISGGGVDEAHLNSYFFDGFDAEHEVG